MFLLQSLYIPLERIRVFYDISRLLPICYPMFTNIRRVGLAHHRSTHDQMASYKLVWNRKKKLGADNKALVQIEVYLRGRHRYFTTGVRVVKDDWLAKKQEVRKDDQANKRMRKQITDMREFEDNFLRTHGRFFALADFDLMASANGEEAKPTETFSAYMKAEIEADRPGVHPDTSQRRIKVLNRFNLHHGGLVAFGDLTYPFIRGFDQAMRGRFGDNTIEAEHKILKRYISRAVKYRLLDHNPYDGFPIKGRRVDKVILDDTEIKRLEVLTFEGKDAQLTIYRDGFLLAYYTMLRISDLTTLTPEHISHLPDGLLIVKEQQKTKQVVRVGLGTIHGGKGQDLLRKYWPANAGKPFIDRSHQHLNRRLKDVLKLANITKAKVGFHTARHSGITDLIRRGVPLAMVSQLAGHADIKMTMKYVHLAGVDIEQALNEVTAW